MTNPKPEIMRVLRWVFLRHAHAITCEIDANKDRAYDVCVVPHWDVSASVIERFDTEYQAFERHAEVVRHLREAGWVRVQPWVSDSVNAAA